MSGAPFNPMRKTPPPPPYIDTVSIQPESYISVEPCDGPLFLVSHECLCVSPFLRRAFEKRVDIVHSDIEITFSTPHTDEEDTVMNSSEAAAPGNTEGEGEAGPSSEEKGEAVASEEAVLAPTEHGAADGADEKASTDKEEGEVSVRKKKQETIFPEDPLYAIPKIPRPVEVLKETLQNNKTIRVRFPKLNSAMLEVVIGYMYYKTRYERKPGESREDFNVPIGMALTIIKLAALLEC